MEFPKPSAYTPFFRRFTNERAREIKETRNLYDWVVRNPIEATPIGIGREVYPYYSNAPLADELSMALYDVLQLERYLLELPPPDFERFSMQEFVEFRNLLHHKQFLIQNQERILEKLQEALVRIFRGIAGGMPSTATPTPFTIPLIYALPEPGLFITQLTNLLYEDDYVRLGLFNELRVHLNANLYAASGLVQGEVSRKPFKFAHESDLTLDKLNDAYLGGTPFHSLMLVPVPLKLTHGDRFNHMHVVGGTGAGKTTLLENLILHDLKSEHPPSLVIIDSQGDLIRKLSHLDCFDPTYGEFKDKLVLITPKDIKHPPALNIFDLNRSRLGSYDEVTKEQVVAGVIETFDYLFSGLLGADLTANRPLKNP